MMCSGTIVQFGIPKVVIGENKTFGGNEKFLISKGIDVVIANDKKMHRINVQIYKRKT